jgi:hypothetical protein
MKPSHKNLAPAEVAAAVVALVAAVVVVAIAAGAGASNAVPTSSRCRRGASTEAPLHVIPHSSYLTFNLS